MKLDPSTHLFRRPARALGRVALLALAMLLGIAHASSAEEILPAPGEILERELSGGELHHYGLDWLQGNGYWLTAHQEGIDLSVSIVTTTGEARLGVDNPGGRWGAEQMRFRVEAGDQAIEIRALSEHSPQGRYRLRLEARQQAGPETRGRDSTERSATAAARLYHLGDRDVRNRALSYYREAYAGWRSLGRDAEAAATLFHIALLERALEGHRQGLETLRKALDRFERLGDRQGRARTWMEIGRTTHRLGAREDSEEAYRRSLDLWRALEDRHGQARVLGNWGLLHMESDPPRAKILHQEALALARDLGDTRQEGASLSNLGGLFALTGEPAQALECYERALLIHQKNGDLRQEAAAWNNIASIHRRTGRLQEALEGFSASLAARPALGDRRGQALVLNNLGLTWLDLGDTHQARDALTRALAIRREIDDPKGEATNLHNLGLVYAETGNWQKALEVWSETLTLRQGLEDRNGEAAVLISLGQAAQGLGRLPQARRFLEEALDLLEDLDNPWRRAKAWWVLGQVLTATGNPDEASVVLQRSADTYRALEDSVAEGNALLALADAEGAAHEQRQDGSEMAYEHALKALDLLETVRSDVDSPHLRTSFLARHAQAFEATIELAMELDKRRPGQGWSERALEISERARARSLLDLLRQSGVRPASGIDSELLERQQALLASLQLQVGDRRRRLESRGSSAKDSQLVGQIAALRHQLATVDQEIHRSSPAWAPILAPTPLDISEIQALLGPEALLLEYALGEKRSFLWAVTASSVESHELPGRKVIEAAAREVHENLRVLDPRRREEDVESARRMSDLLLGPVAGRLGGKRLAIVADGALHYLPFSALPQPGTGPEAKSEPLLVRHEIVHLPSASALGIQRRALAERPRARKLLAVLADPVFGPPDPRLSVANPTPTAELPSPAAHTPAKAAPTLAEVPSGESELTRLPWSRWEAEKIVRKVGRGSLLALGFEADLDTVRSGNLVDYRWIHFATHGVVESEHPELSALVLSRYDAEGRRREGFLRLPQIYNLELNADLVVLSGCRTALGQEVRGEGLIGLTHGFFAAGARRLIASLWRVQDRASAELMVRFYERLVEEGVSQPDLRPAAVLREAQLELRAQPGFEDPYYWAAFAVYGDW